MQGTPGRHGQPAGAGRAAPASRRGSPGAAAHQKALPRRAAISSTSPRASSAVHIPQPDTSKTSYSLPSSLQSGTSTLRSHPKAFSGLISALPTLPVHTSICKMWGLEETWCCGYPAAKQYQPCGRLFILLQQQERKITCWTAIAVSATGIFQPGLVFCFGKELLAK